MAKRAYQVFGVVQGVGFRPFIYRLAMELGLTGIVRNEGDFVHIELQGGTEYLQAFLTRLQSDAPPAAVIVKIQSVAPNYRQFEDFQIVSSATSTTHHFSIPPDLGICPACVEEMRDPASRYYRYPFISCTNCGPRYTITADLPFDRHMTTMNQFTFCQDCERDYLNPSSRRCHAQATACEACGPQLSWLDGTGSTISGDQALQVAKTALRDGKIVAILGIGGFHLAVDAHNSSAVQRLRNNKGRPAKPFAVMMNKKETASQADVTEGEWQWLTSPIRPIVLVTKSPNFSLSPDIAPNLGEIGVMFPYTGLHELLLDDERLSALVMTSGNASGDPLAFSIQEGRERLRGIVDAFLVHHREILRPVDDSVIRVRGPLQMIRRSRGFVPGGKQVEWRVGGAMPTMLAVGGDLKNAFAIAHSEMVWVSPYLGDLEHERSQTLYTNEINWYLQMVHHQLDVIIHDEHPGYFSTRFAMSRPEPKIAVQHHHAHMAAVLMEYDIRHPVIGVILDGTGYGEGGEFWGGEVLVGDLKAYVRMGHIAQTRIISGDQAVREPWRLVYSYLHEWGLWDEFGSFVMARLQVEEQALRMMQVVQQSRYKGWVTSSMGRLFDVVGALVLGVGKASFEGELPMRLESLVNSTFDPCGNKYDFPVIDHHGTHQLHVGILLRQILLDIQQKYSVDDIATKFHRSIVNGLVQLTNRVGRLTAYRDVVVSGGVWMNAVLLQAFVQEMTKHGYRVYYPQTYPANDGGLALGQMAVAIAKLEMGDLR